MAVPSGKRIGTTSVRVIPDATKFRNDLKLLLKRVENSMSANLEVVADTARFDSDMRKLLKKWNGQSVNIDVDAKTLGASAHLKEFTRPRTVPIVVKVSKASVAKAATLIASLSGGRLVGDIIKDVATNIQNLDRALPKLALVSQAIGSIGAAGLNAVRGSGAVLIQLTQLLPLASLLPGVLVGAGLGLTTLIVALKDAPKRLGSAATAYKALGAVISNNFWAKATVPVRSLLTTLLPQVREGFVTLSSDIGSTVGGIATTFKNAFSGGVLKSVFSDISSGASAAAPGLNAFTSSFVSLLTFGAKYLPVFGDFISKIGVQFDTWLTGVEASGQLNQDITNAITLLGNLGGVLHSVGGILTGIFNAGSGGDPLGGLATGLAGVSAVINSAGFQTALTTIFAGASVGASALAGALVPIGHLLGVLAPAISGILSSSGITVGKLLDDVASALEQPAFQIGLQSFFSGIQQGLLAIAPSLPAVAQAFGELGQFAGLLASQVGSVLGEAFSALAPILSQVLLGLEPVLPILGGALIDAIKELAPLLPGLISSLVPLLPTLADFVKNLLPELVADLEILLPLVEGFIVHDLNPLLQAITWLIGLGTGTAKFFSDFVAGVNPLTLSMEALQGKFGPVLQLASQFGEGLRTFLHAGVISFIKDINLVIGALNGLVGVWNGFASGVEALTGGSIKLKIGTLPSIPVPHAATGLGVSGSSDGVLALIGEAGRAEDVVDHGNMNALINGVNALLQRQATGGVGGGSIAQYNTVQMAPDDDPRLVFRQLGREFANGLAT